MKIEERKIKEIFTTNAGADKFIIPDYQRPYVWNEDRTEEYFNDLLNNNDVNLPFLGSFIFQKHKTGYDIVDGQQRFITTAILIAVLRDIAGEKKVTSNQNDTIKHQLESFYSQAKIRLVDIDALGVTQDVILTVWEDERDFFEKYILNDNKEKIKDISGKPRKKDLTKYNIYKNYLKLFDLVNENFKDDEPPTILLNQIITRLDEMQIVAIYVDGDEEAYTAFEIVNARGEALGNIDLLKNLFYKSASAVDQLDWMKNAWTEVVNYIEDSSGAKVNTESFLKFFWHSYYGGSRFATAKTIFPKFKQYISEKGYKIVAEQLLENAKLFKTFFDLIDYEWTNEDRYNKKILASFKFLRAFNITQSYILFLSIIRNKLDSRKIKNIIQATEKFHFAYSVVSKKQANKVEKLYGKYAEEFEKTDKGDSNKIGTIYNQFLEKLEELFPKENEFLENFYELSYSKKKDAIRYVFYKIHESDNKGATTLNFESTDANLEHINSQTQTESNFTNDLLHSIGNIMPLSKIDNSRAGNKTLKEKIQEYEASGTSIPIINEVIKRLEKNNYKWGKKDIENWAKYLGEKIYAITKKLR
ncbi:MAG TPA: DUF262 domain-containing protein [Candidatus Moranbacteria bacterium]|nr:DUF262 domain-containing protein [Candidatus Moranbacteria bacterium]